MGLDTYAMKNVLLDDELFKDTGELYGGMFSHSGNSPSFRGKVYADFINDKTGVSLYQEKIEDDDLIKIKQGIQVFIDIANKEEKKNFEDEWGFPFKHLQHLANWFQVVIDNDGYVSGWW